MVQSPSWAADWFAASQEILRISRNPKIHHRTHKRTPPVPILGQPNPVHISKQLYKTYMWATYMGLGGRKLGKRSRICPKGWMVWVATQISCPLYPLPAPYK